MTLLYLPFTYLPLIRLDDEEINWAGWCIFLSWSFITAHLIWKTLCTTRSERSRAKELLVLIKRNILHSFKLVLLRNPSKATRVWKRRV